MRPLFISCILFLLCSCKVLTIAENKNSRNVTEIAIDTFYEGKADNEYTSEIKASLENVMRRFNNENHVFKVHNKTKTDKLYLTLDFSKIKVINSGGAAAGYIISGLGLLAAPVGTVYLSGGTWALGFYYFPVNRVSYSASLSSNLDGSGNIQLFDIQTGALFRNKIKRVESLKMKFEKIIYETLIKLETQLKSH